MKAVRHLLALVALALAATTASAQFVKGNEAVKVMPDGTKKVETPPLPSRPRSAQPCAADKPAAPAAAGRWSKPRTGFAECTEVYARPGDLPCHRPTARRSVSRLWIVKTGASGCSASTPTSAASA